MEIKTARLYMRDLIEADWPPVHRLHTDPRVYRFNHFGPEAEAESRAWVVETWHIIRIWSKFRLIEPNLIVIRLSEMHGKQGKEEDRHELNLYYRRMPSN